MVRLNQQNNQSLGQLFGPLLLLQLILCMTTLSLNNCLTPPRHAFYESLTLFWSDFVPLFSYPIPQFMNSPGWPRIFLQLVLEVNAKVFYGI
jgi:hypothetical protein